MNETKRTGLSRDQVVTLIGAIGPLVATIGAMVMVWAHLVTWRDVLLLLTIYFFTGIGITLGYHRMLTHRSFHAHPAVRFCLLALGCSAGHTDPVRWASIHIQHHARSDTEEDPHTPLEGLFYAHFGWIYAGLNPQPEIYGKWLLQDRMVLFFQRTFLLWVALGFIVPYLLDGWRGLLWGGLVRMFLSHHITFSVNSICHTFGQRPFATGDRSTNQWLVGLLALGEGWHNNHHAFPQSAFHGLRWWQIDLSAYVILLLERLGLVSRVQRISPAAQAARLAKPILAAPAATGRHAQVPLRGAHQPKDSV
jgi:stearoyl-CoA desaturase (Delta-9 desaturase)